MPKTNAANGKPAPVVLVWVRICQACGKERPRETAETPKDLKAERRFCAACWKNELAWCLQAEAQRRKTYKPTEWPIESATAAVTAPANGAA